MRGPGYVEGFMADYPAEFEFDVLLRDGDVVHMRPIRPDDVDLLRRFYGRVGPQSAYFRFFRVKRELSPEELIHFTNVDYDDRMALIAIHDGEMVAVGRYDVFTEKTTEEGKVAEVAFLVEDAFQGRGIGTQLLQQLTVYARSLGITKFEAFVLRDNRAMMRMFRDSGYTLTRELDEGVFGVEFPIEYSLEAREAEWEHERRAVTASLMPLLYPTSAAVIGASRDEESIGGRLFANLLAQGFSGPVYPVNPKSSYVHAVKAYPTVLDIDEPVDLAFIAVPAGAVLDVINQCGEKGVRGIVVISAGFSETGGPGAEMEAAVLTAARRFGMRMVGPNCMGLLNADPTVSLDGQFGPVFPPAGNVAMASQSGALGLAILNEAKELGIGLSTFVSLGNRADVSANDLLLYWDGDPATDVIVLYMESFGHARRFGRLARRVSRTKPIVVVKAGRSSAGARAAASHTGSLASLDVAVDALFNQSGVIRTRTLNELFDVASLLANQPLPRGPRVAILTNAGGPAILAADALESFGLELPEFSPELQGRLSEFLPDEASVSNPVDMIASASPYTYGACLTELLATDEVDAVIVIYIPAAPKGTEEVIAAMTSAIEEATRDTTIAAVLMAAEEEIEALTRAANVPVYDYPESAAHALAAAFRYREWRERPEGVYPKFDTASRTAADATIRAAISRLGTDGGWLEDAEISEILGAYGIRTARSVKTTTEDEAVAAAAEINGPAVLKIVSPSTLHKSDVGGVVLGVEGEDAVRAVYRQVSAISDDVEAVLVQDFVAGGHEVIIGMTEDPLFGPLIVFGLGGIFVELMRDVSFRINPLTDVDAREMLSEVRSAEILKGYRGGEAGDIAALEEILLRVSTLVDQHPEIADMDLNPVKVLPPGEGICVVDARMRIRPIEGVFLPSRKDIPGRLL
jgi:acetyl coenzyme A synthetase (ADP forming)-like protein